MKEHAPPLPAFPLIPFNDPALSHFHCPPLIRERILEATTAAEIEALQREVQESVQQQLADVAQAFAAQPFDLKAATELVVALQYIEKAQQELSRKS
jgi:hypothetical protein